MPWLYQIRIRVSKELSEALRTTSQSAEVIEINAIAQKHGTRLVCTFDGFSDYCAEAEQNGTEDYPLYDWTKQTISNPEKVQKHLRSFAFYKGDEQVYSLALADALFFDLEILLKSLKHHTKMLANTLLIMKFMKPTQTETLLPIFQSITLI